MIPISMFALASAKVDAIDTELSPPTTIGKYSSFTFSIIFL